MAEFQFGPPPPAQERSTADRLRTVWEWFIAPDDTGNLIPPSAVQSIADEIDDQLRGRAENGAAENKGIKKGIEKLIRGGPLGEAIVDVLFGDNKAGAPDPPGRRGPVQFDESGAPYQLNERGERVQVQMLPMWLADP